MRLRIWRKSGRLGTPWILDLGDHREVAGNPVTPLSQTERNATAFRDALEFGKVFCAATHYWELGARSLHQGEPTVRGQLHRLIELARSDSRVRWRSVGETILEDQLVLH